MPYYLKCPHCEHPQIVPKSRRGKTRFCRQCGRAFITAKDTDEVYPLPVSSMGELYARTNGAKTFVLIA